MNVLRKISTLLLDSRLSSSNLALIQDLLFLLPIAAHSRHPLFPYPISFCRRCLLHPCLLSYRPFLLGLLRSWLRVMFVILLLPMYSCLVLSCLGKKTLCILPTRICSGRSLAFFCPSSTLPYFALCQLLFVTLVFLSLSSWPFDNFSMMTSSFPWAPFHNWGQLLRRQSTEHSHCHKL